MQSARLTVAELKSVKTLIKERFDFVYGDAHGVAYLLDPRYAGEGMDTMTRSAVEGFLESWYGDEKADKVVLELSGFQRLVAELKRRSQRRWQLLCDNKLPMYEFWCGLPQFPLLQEIAMQVFRCAASSSASERNFSTYGYIHSKLRNRLAPERIEKLVHIFFNAKNVNDEERATYSHLEDLLRGDLDDSSNSDKDCQDDDFVYY